VLLGWKPTAGLIMPSGRSGRSRTVCRKHLDLLGRVDGRHPKLDCFETWLEKMCLGGSGRRARMMVSGK